MSTDAERPADASASNAVSTAPNGSRVMQELSVAEAIHQTSVTNTTVGAIAVGNGARAEGVVNVTVHVHENPAAQDQIGNQLSELLRLVQQEPRLNKVFAKLADEARVHYERGVAHQSQEEFGRAVTSLDDARRLLEVDAIDAPLLARVLVLLGAVKGQIGWYRDSLVDSERAIPMLQGTSERELLLFARGNRAVVLYQLQQFEEATLELEEILHDFEGAGDLFEVTRTLQHLAELAVERKDIDGASQWVARLMAAADSLQRLGSPGNFLEFVLGARATSANCIVLVGLQLDGESQRNAFCDALRIYDDVAKTANAAGLKRLSILTTAQIAQCHWNLDELERAEETYANIVDDTGHEFAQVSARAQFNRALIRKEQRKFQEAAELFADARSRFARLGDDASIADVDAQLEKMA